MIVARWDRRDNNGTICKQRFYIFPADLSSLVQIVIQSSVERHAKVPCMLGYLRIYIVSVRTYVRKYYVHVQINKVNKVRKLDMDNNILIVFNIYI